MKYRRISQYRRISKKEMEKVHVYIPEVYEQLKQGRISRREFMRTATLLGMSAGVATIAAACGTGGGTTVQEPVAEEPVAEEPAAEEPVVEEEAATGGIVRGGVLREGEQVKAVDHPARYSWGWDADQTRLVYEYLTETDSENITHPYLLERWVPNDDLTVWDLILREGINWTNGDPLTAEDVKWNFEEWLNLDTGSSILALWEGFLTSSGLEVVDERTLRLNLTAPLLAVPENLFHYPAQIIHPSFDGDITSGNTPSTGPHILEEYIVGERVRTVARWSTGDEGYWQMGADGKPLTYLEAMEWIDLGEEGTAYVSALQSGQIDVYNPDASEFLALRGNENIKITSIGTSQTQTLRFRVDLDPWGDVRLRNAVKMVQDREKILDNAYFGEGDLGYDVHVAPVHPEWTPMDLPAYDPEGARALLDEAGVETLDFSISVGTGWDYIVSYIETLAEDAKAAGINITLDTMPESAYWDLWTETPVGVTTWTHRPLAVMLLPLAYIADSEGNPVPWNESRWVDEEFSAILKEAQGTLDLEARRALTAELQRIQLERGSIGIAYFRNTWMAHVPGFQGISAHPTDYRLYREVWFDPEMAS